MNPIELAQKISEYLENLGVVLIRPASTSAGFTLKPTNSQSEICLYTEDGLKISIIKS